MLTSPLYTPPKKQNLLRRFALLALILPVVAGIVLLSTTGGSGSGAAAKARQVVSALGVSAWKIDTEPELVHPGQRFGGIFYPEQVLMVPAGSVFSVRPQPTLSRGAFVEPNGVGLWDHSGGELNPGADVNGMWKQECRAPMQCGLYKLQWRDDSNEPRTLNVLVLTRADVQHDSKTDKKMVKVFGKSIGGYADPADAPVRRVRENAAQYQPPHFFAQLGANGATLKIGDNLELGQLIAFRDKRDTEGRKIYTTERHTDFLPPRADLIDKLIKLRERLRQKNVPVTKFWITSGFRTPDYNRSIGGATFSRHCYGDAVDLCIDENDDKRMDDLNGDGKIDRKDGLVIANAVRELEAEGAVVVGGIGVYEWDGDDSVRSHVHIDCRGYVSRWGQIGSGKGKKSFIWWPKAEFQDDDAGE